MNATVCDVVVDTLESAGVREVFGIPGDAINSLVDSIRRNSSVRFIRVQHEESGAFAASAQGKLTGNLAVCCGTSGPGAIHLLNGLYDARKDCVPVLAITGQVATAELGSGYHQEVNLDRLFSDVSVYSRTIINPKEAARIIAAACQAALSRRGVAHISIPSDIAGERCSAEPIPVVKEIAECRPSTAQLKKAAEILNASKKPAILMGIGASDCVDQVIRIAEKLSAPIVHTLRAKELLPNDHPANAGGLGLLGGRPGVDAIDNCDALLMIGTDFPYREFLPADVAVVQIERNPERVGRRVPVASALLGDAGLALELLEEHLEMKRDNDFLEKIRVSRRRQLDHYAVDENRSTSPVHPARLARALGDLSADNAIFCCDTGEVTVWAARHLPLKGTQRFTLSANLASMAYALPAALGAQLSFPGRQVVALCGDGGFSMLMADIRTAANHSLPIKFVIFDNRRLGLIQDEQETEGLPSYAINLDSVDYAAYAELCGISGYLVEQDEGLESALECAFAASGPALVDVKIDSDVLPFSPKIHLIDAVNFTKAKFREFFSSSVDDS